MHSGAIYTQMTYNQWFVDTSVLVDERSRAALVSEKRSLIQPPKVSNSCDFITRHYLTNHGHITYLGSFLIADLVSI